jgi:uncharacterized membrane protein
MRTKEETDQYQCVMKCVISINQVLLLAQISVKVIYDSNQITVRINTAVSGEDKQRPWSCYQTGSSRSHVGWPPLSGGTHISKGKVFPLQT